MSEIPSFRRQRSLRVAVTVVLALFLVTDIGALVIGGSVLEAVARRRPTAIDFRALVVGLYFGMFTSQLMLAVAYSALGRGASLKRIIYALGLVTVFAYVLITFNVWWFPTASLWWFPKTRSGVSPLAPVLFLFLLQIPLWIFRCCSGWIILSPNSSSITSKRMRFSVAHMLGWAAFLSLPLCVLTNETQLAANGTALVRFLFLMCFWATVIGAMVLSLIYIALVVDAKGRFIRVAAISIIGAVVIQLASVWLWEGGVTNSMITIAAANVFGAPLFVACLRLARTLGYRLQPFHSSAMGT